MCTFRQPESSKSVSMSAAEHSRIWDMHDLNMFDCVENAVCVNVYGLYEDQHRYT